MSLDFATGSFGKARWLEQDNRVQSQIMIQGDGLTNGPEDGFGDVRTIVTSSDIRPVKSPLQFRRDHQTSLFIQFHLKCST